jgi:hypothetical protein
LVDVDMVQALGELDHMAGVEVDDAESDHG